MKRNSLIVVLVGALIALGAAAAWLMIGQRDLESQLNLKETEIAAGQATLVQVFSDQRTTLDENEDALATSEADLSALRSVATDVAPLVQTQTASGSVPTATPAPTLAADGNAPPQIRIRLGEPEPIKIVGESIEIIASASHPLGIASLNILINDELLLAQDPFDPRMDIAVSEWTPLETGTYEIKAIASTIRGRVSDPVILQIEVIETDDAEVLLDTQLRLIEKNVQELRGLDQKDVINVNVIDRNNLQENIGTDLLGEFTREQADLDVLVLSSFDFMPRDYPLYESLVELYGFVVLGYYDEETDSLFVISDDNVLDEEEKLTHAHEFMHALQDQHFTLADIQNGALDADATMALRSLAEGEATLLELTYRRQGYLTGEQSAVSSPVLSLPESIPAPNFVANQLAFPYVRGQEFLLGFFEEGGFEAINQIWQNPPASTEQILHVDRYLAGDQPQLVELPTEDILAELGDGWEQVAEDVFGEFNVIEYLSLALTEDEVNPAALGWGGDRYEVFYNASTDERVMVMKMVWDTPADQAEFAEAYTQWAEILLGREVDGGGGENISCWQNQSDQQCLILLADELFITRSESAEISNKLVPLLNR